MVQVLREEFGLNKNLFLQYVDYIKGLVTGDLLGEVIPPAATLVFDVEVMGIPRVEITTTEEGTGPVAELGDQVNVHYTGWLEDGTKFDSSRDRSDPFSFPVDCSYVIRGWDEGVKGMQVGGKRRLVVPPDLGYGAQGAGGVIPPNATLVFEIELLEIST